MNRERLFKHLEDHYIPKREMISRIPLGVQPDEFWQDVLNRRRARSISLPLHNPRGIPYWYVVTGKMISASEQIVSEMMDNETEFDPYKNTPAASSLEESFFTSYVEGSQLSLQDAMEFLQGEREPQEPEEQMIINNRNALSFTGANLFRPVDEEYIRTLAYILTENMDGGGQEYRLDDCPPIPSMMGIPYELPVAAAMPDRVNEICMFLHDPTIHPLIKSGIAQAWVLVTRPFPEGNERLGRLLSQVILFRAGYVFFSEISLSSLIARTSYAYFNAITNILLPENGADLTYFLEYYMTLLAKAVEERHLRIRQREAQELHAERTMAQTPLTPPPEQTQMDIDDYADPPFEPDERNPPGESGSGKGGDEGSNDNIVARARIMALFESRSERLKKSAEVLLQFLDEGKTTISVMDIVEAMNVDIDTGGNIITQLKSKEILVSLKQEDKFMLYTFCGENKAPEKKQTRSNFREVLLRLSKNSRSIIGRGTGLLLKYLDREKNTFSSAELQEELKISAEQTYRICYHLKEQGLIILTGYLDEKPIYALAYEENEAAHTKPATPGRKSQIAPRTYSKSFMSRLEELNASTRSTKDRRIAMILTDCLPRGMVTEQDYKNADCANSWHKDMRLAEQMGLVKKYSQGCYRIMNDIKPGPAPLSSTQKEVATAMYQSFGDEVFSTEMVIATLDYTASHVSAVLHQFTLFKILNCNSNTDEGYTYQFIVNPKENPECFVDVA